MGLEGGGRLVEVLLLLLRRRFGGGVVVVDTPSRRDMLGVGGGGAFWISWLLCLDEKVMLVEVRWAGWHSSRVVIQVS